MIFLNVSFIKGATNVQAAKNNQTDPLLSALMQTADSQGAVRVIVKLDVPVQPEGELPSEFAIQSQQRNIDSAQAQISRQMAETSMETIVTFDHIPFMAVKVNASDLEQLAMLPNVVSIEEDIPIPPTLASTIPIIGADKAWTNGYTGAGQTVAILDTGVDLDHPAFTTGGNRIVAEGCYSTTDAGYGAQSVCPGGVSASTLPGSGADCVASAAGYTGAQSSCTHGTHVAGIVAGNDGATFGVAKEANIISVQIFSLFASTAYCGGASSCALTFTSDQIAGLERVYDLRNTHDIAAVNMSLGGSTPYASPCDSDSRKAMIDALRSVGIATIIASGNNGYKDGISKPACISSAISVGATDDADQVASYSNVSPILDLLAPGSAIYSAVPNNTYATKSGTSMATPHVAGAWAVYKQAVPGASVDDVLEAFKLTGTLVNDNRSAGVEVDLPRINVDQAVNSYIPGLTVSLSASHSYALAGDLVTYTISVQNQTAIPATNVVISDVLPLEMTLSSGSLSADASVLSNLSGTVVRWDSGETLPPNGSLSRSFTAVVNPGGAGSLLENVAFAMSPEMVEVRFETAVTQIVQPATCDFSDGFESGQLGSAWMVEKTEDGRISITDALPQSGSFSLLLDDSVAGGTFSQASAILTADLMGQSEILLSFDWYDLADEYDALYDGVFIREKAGDIWIKIFDFDGTNSDAYQNTTINLEDAATNNGLLLTNTFQIKFGFYDNYPALFDNISGGDGYAIDNVSMSCEPAGLTLTQTVNKLSLDPGQLMTHTLVVANHDPNIATSAIISSTIPVGLRFFGPVELLGSSGNVAFDDSDLPNIASGLIVPSNGQITIKVPMTVDYGLAGGTLLHTTFFAKSAEHPDWVSVSQPIVVKNVAPLVLDDFASTTRNTAVSISPLQNDSDNNGDSLQITAVSFPSNGIATTDGTTIQYTPSETFAGTESIEYTVSDGAGGVTSGTLFVEVQNVAPTAHDDSTASLPAEPVYYPVLINDTDVNAHELTITAVSTPANGSAFIDGELIVYTSEQGFAGTAVLTYTISDGYGGEASAQLSVQVGVNANGAPIAQNDERQTERDERVTISVLDNDMDPNLDTVLLITVSTPAYGTAVIQEDKIEYTPAQGFVGVDTFSYTIRDSKGALTTGEVTVFVALENTQMFSVDPNQLTNQTFTSSDNKVTLVIPPGALPAGSAQIAYTVLPAPPSPLSSRDAGVYFALNLSNGPQTFVNNPTFSPALELTLRYDPAQLPASIAEDELALYYFDEAVEEWVEIEINGRNPANNTLTIQLTHFTDFALGANHAQFLPLIINGN